MRAQLQRALDDAGLSTGNSGLQFSLRDQSSSGQDDGGGSGRNAHRLIVSEEDSTPACRRGTNLWPHARFEQRRRYQDLRRTPWQSKQQCRRTIVSAPATNPPTRPPPRSTASTGLADNFQTFLTLLTTQLQNQNPLDPLDTNQFTQQLVQFAGVEQQLKSNDQLKALIAIEKSAQSTNALIYVGNTVAVDGSTQQFNGSATWNLKAEKSTTAAITITNSVGQTVYSGNFALTDAKASFIWDGKGNDGTQWPAGAYKMTATGKDSAGKDVGHCHGDPGHRRFRRSHRQPAFALDRRENYTTDQIRRVIRPTPAPTPDPAPAT